MLMPFSSHQLLVCSEVAVIHGLCQPLSINVGFTLWSFWFMGYYHHFCLCCCCCCFRCNPLLLSPSLTTLFTGLFKMLSAQDLSNMAGRFRSFHIFVVVGNIVIVSVSSEKRFTVLLSVQIDWWLLGCNLISFCMEGVECRECDNQKIYRWLCQSSSLIGMIDTCFIVRLMRW